MEELMKDFKMFLKRKVKIQKYKSENKNLYEEDDKYIYLNSNNKRFIFSKKDGFCLDQFKVIDEEINYINCKDKVNKASLLLMGIFTFDKYSSFFIKENYNNSILFHYKNKKYVIDSKGYVTDDYYKILKVERKYPKKRINKFKELERKKFYPYQQPWDGFDTFFKIKGIYFYNKEENKYKILLNKNNEIINPPKGLSKVLSMEKNFLYILKRNKKYLLTVSYDRETLYVIDKQGEVLEIKNNKDKIMNFISEYEKLDLIKTKDFLLFRRIYKGNCCYYDLKTEKVTLFKQYSNNVRIFFLKNKIYILDFECFITKKTPDRELELFEIEVDEKKKFNCFLYKDESYLINTDSEIVNTKDTLYEQRKKILKNLDVLKKESKKIKMIINL